MKSSVITSLVVLLLGSFAAAAPTGTVDIQLNDPEVLNARTTSETDIQELVDPAVLNA
ncbi:hypothetical protein BKA66DRAFT_576859 [Pyrenochaeta sp. MPI-SDFR-AT-0127]|nr:hypothetical protein BKA66DRAFT_576859 [Pyrenochaeta sp. MPI-SDFR-AT-0127]